MGTTIEIVNNQHLERLLMENPDMTRKVQAIVRKVIKKARASVQNSAASVLTNDPRRAYEAVRFAIYKAILGGQINILNPRKASGGGDVSTSRRGRTADTERIMGYYGADRAFILRFIEEGTAQRTATYMNGHPIKLTEKKKGYSYKAGIGNRGAIRPRPWFNNASTTALETASAEFDQLITALIQKEYNA